MEQIIPILPRPVRKEEPLTPIAPRPVKREQPNPQPVPADAPSANPAAGNDAQERKGFTPGDILLEAITTTARKPQTQTTRDALRVLILKFNTQCGLDF